MKYEADSLVKQGSGYIYNLQFAEAEKCFKRVIEISPNHPAGYFMDAMIDWWSFKTGARQEQIEERFLSKIEKCLETCETILDTATLDITGLFFKGGALGYRARFYVETGSYLRAARDGTNALDVLIKCQQLGVRNSDIMLGLGIYNYYAVALPENNAALQAVMTMFPSGDKKIGLMQLNIASKNARYASTEAKVVLLQAYYQFEKNTTEALRVSRELVGSYPNNPYFHAYLGRCLVRSGNSDSAETVWRDVVNRCWEKHRGYTGLMLREGCYYIGYYLMGRRDFDMALKYLFKSDEGSRYLDQDPSGFMIKTNLKIGNIYDMQGKRNLALNQYDKVLAWKDNDGSHKEAERYKQTPYGK